MGTIVMREMSRCPAGPFAVVTMLWLCVLSFCSKLSSSNKGTLRVSFHSLSLVYEMTRPAQQAGNKGTGLSRRKGERTEGFLAA